MIHILVKKIRIGIFFILFGALKMNMIFVLQKYLIKSYSTMLAHGV